jgi:hypothetical protein
VCTNLFRMLPTVTLCKNLPFAFQLAFRISFLTQPIAPSALTVSWVFHVPHNYLITLSSLSSSFRGSTSTFLAKIHIATSSWGVTRTDSSMNVCQCSWRPKLRCNCYIHKKCLEIELLSTFYLQYHNNWI